MEPANLDPYEVIGDPYPTTDFCEQCNEALPTPDYEERADGEYEIVTYCKCGATYYERKGGDL
jgi:hypothetical protein